MFNEVFQKLVKDISGISKFSEEEIERSMEKTCQPNKPNVTLFLLKISKNAAEDTKELYEKLLESSDIDTIENITVRGPSISFDLNKKKIYKKIFKYIHENKKIYGNNRVGENKTMIVEYSSPNIAKIFHIGHFRTTVLGQFIANLLEASGFKVIRMNYLGDWGKQFGLVLLGYERYGSEEALKENPLRHLFNVYVKISKELETDPTVDTEAKEIFRKMEEEKNQKYLNLWTEFRKLSIEKYKSLYNRLNISFDVYSGESLYNEKGKELIENCEFTQKDEDGSKVFDLGSLGKALVMKNDGATLYMTRDLAAAKERIEEYNPEKIIYVVSVEQNRYLQQLFKSMEIMGYDKNKFLHVSYGMVRGMSTRKGKVEFLEDIINLATSVMKKEILSNEDKASKIENIDETAEILATSTLLIMDFSAKRVKGYEFDVEKRAKNVSGTGPYLQYAHCRLKSIEEMNSHLDIDNIDTINLDLLNSQEVLDVAYKLLWFEHVVELCLEDYEPSRIVTYIQDLASTINVLINNLRVKGEEQEIARARLFVLSSARIVLHNALKLLGIIPLNKM